MGHGVAQVQLGLHLMVAQIGLVVRQKRPWRGIGYDVHKNHHADRSALGTNRDEREQTNGRLSCRMKFEEEAHYNAR